VVGEIEQAFDGGLVDMGDDFGEAFGAEAADALQRERELRVIGHLFEGFEGDVVGAAEPELGHGGLVPVVEDGVDEVEGDLGCGGGVHAGKVRRPRGGSRGIGRMDTKLRTSAVHTGRILNAGDAEVTRMAQSREEFSTRRSRRARRRIGDRKGT